MQIHNKFLYNRYYKKFFDAYIDFYCDIRHEGYTKEDSSIIAKVKLQDFVLTEILDNKKFIELIYRAYTDIKHDQQLLEKATRQLEFEKEN